MSAMEQLEFQEYFVRKLTVAAQLRVPVKRSVPTQSHAVAYLTFTTCSIQLNRIVSGSILSLQPSNLKNLSCSFCVLTSNMVNDNKKVPGFSLVWFSSFSPKTYKIWSGRD